MRQSLCLESPREFFDESVDRALKRVGFKPLPASRTYLIDLLQHYMLTSNLYEAEAKMLAEVFLRAQSAPSPIKQDLLKKLGDRSLYISGFFGDSLTRKLVDIEYYVGMGGAAYGALAPVSADHDLGRVYAEFSAHFAEFVDVLTCISQTSLIQTNHDLLKLYDRYLATGSRLAEEQLMEMGLLNADVQKSKTSKM